MTAHHVRYVLAVLCLIAAAALIVRHPPRCRPGEQLGFYIAGVKAAGCGPVIKP